MESAPLLPVIDAAPKEVIASPAPAVPPHAGIVLVLFVAVIFAVVYWRMSKHLKRSVEEIEAMKRAEQARLAAQASAAQITDPDVATAVFMQMNTAYYVAQLQALTHSLREHGFRLTKEPDKSKAIWYCSLPYTVHTHVAKRVAIERIKYLYPAESDPEDRVKAWLEDGWAHKLTGDMLAALRTLGFSLEQTTEQDNNAQAVQYTAHELAVLDAEASAGEGYLPSKMGTNIFSVVDEIRSH